MGHLALIAIWTLREKTAEDYFPAWVANPDAEHNLPLPLISFSTQKCGL